MLNCLNIDCDTDLLAAGINIGDWTCLWFDFLNEQEWDKCNLWCSGASVIECRNYSQITFIHIIRDYPMNFWWPTFFDCWTSLASMCMYVTRTWTHISQWRPQSFFYHAENLLRHFFKTLCAYKDIDLLSDVQYLFRALCEWTTFTFC